MVEKPTPSSERPHSKLGSSTCERWFNCTGSISLYNLLPELIESSEMKEGTVAHDLAEDMQRAYFTEKFTGETIEVPVSESHTEEMKEGASELIRIIWEEFLEKSVTNKVIGFEDRFDVIPRFDSYGYADCWGLAYDDKGKRWGYIGDYKFGRVEVEAEYEDETGARTPNMQLVFLACGLYQYALTEYKKELEYVRAFIYQPRSEESFKELRLTAKQIQTWLKRLTDKAADIYNPDKKPKFKVGKWCKWCRASAVCKTYIETMQEESQVALIEREWELPEAASLTEEQLNRIVPFVPKFKKWCDTVLAHGKSEKLRNPDFLPEMKLVEGQSRSKWLDNTEEIGEHLKTVGVSDPYSFKLKGIGEISAQLKRSQRTTTEARSIVFNETHRTENKVDFAILIHHGLHRESDLHPVH